MHVAIYGAGALGAVYGVRLANRTGVEVSFVVRPTRLPSTEPMVIDSVYHAHGGRERLDVPARFCDVPADADVVLLAVGTEDLEAVRPVLARTEVPIVVLTPMMPRDYAAMREAFGSRVLAAMPPVVAYRRDDGVVRYWLTPSPTRIDEPSPRTDRDAVRALVSALREAGLPARLELGVHETNPATTVCFIPLAMLVCVAGSARALVRDADLVRLASRACDEGVALGRRIGAPMAGATLSPLLSRQQPLRALVALVERVSPEALHYVDLHFGEKLRVQHQAMAHAMVALALERGTPHDALEEVSARIDDVLLSAR